jgi:hypothetical protein
MDLSKGCIVTLEITVLGINAEGKEVLDKYVIREDRDADGNVLSRTEEYPDA